VGRKPSGARTTVGGLETLNARLTMSARQPPTFNMAMMAAMARTARSAAESASFSRYLAELSAPLLSGCRCVVRLRDWP